MPPHNCRNCLHWGSLDDEKRNRASRLCALSMVYRLGRDGCTAWECRDKVLAKILREMRWKDGT